MLHMIQLDWLGMKCYHLRIIALAVVICVYGLLSEIIIIPAIAFMMLSFSVNPFAVEEKGKLDHLYLTLPVSRKSIVRARFLLSLIMQLAGMVLGIVVTILFSSVLYGRTILFTHTFQADFTSLLLLVCSSLLFYAVLNLSMFPILFKMGYAKGKALGFYIPVGAVGVAVVVLYFLWSFHRPFFEWANRTLHWSYSNPLWMSAILLGLSALVLLVSFLLSQRLYAKREF